MAENFTYGDVKLTAAERARAVAFLQRMQSQVVMQPAAWLRGGHIFIHNATLTDRDTNADANLTAQLNRISHAQPNTVVAFGSGASGGGVTLKGYRLTTNDISQAKTLHDELVAASRERFNAAVEAGHERGSEEWNAAIAAPEEPTTRGQALPAAGGAPAGRRGQREVGLWGGEEGNVGYRPEAETEQEEDTARTTHRERAIESREGVLDETAISRERTPEELRTEKFRRAAERLENEQFWRPGQHMITATGQVAGQRGEAYQRPQIQLADKVQSLRFDALQGDRAAYDTLERYKNANDVLQKIWGGGEMNRNDLERLRRANDEMVINAMNMGLAEITNDINTLSSDIRFREGIREAQKLVGMSQEKIVALGRFAASAGWSGVAIATSFMGGAVPSAEMIALGSLFESAFGTLSGLQGARGL
jgi:hypothetical protein